MNTSNYLWMRVFHLGRWHTVKKKPRSLFRPFMVWVVAVTMIYYHATFVEIPKVSKLGYGLWFYPRLLFLAWHLKLRSVDHNSTKSFALMFDLTFYFFVWPWHWKLDGNLAVFNGLSHGYIYHPTPTPQAKRPNENKTDFTILGWNRFRFHPHPRKTLEFDTKFLTRASYFPSQSSFCERPTRLIDHKYARSFALVK